jgi:hypothetical protein
MVVRGLGSMHNGRMALFVPQILVKERDVP